MHFQADTVSFQFVQSGFQPAIERLFNQGQTRKRSTLNLRWVILLDSESTTDLFCNRELCKKVWESYKHMTMRSTDRIAKKEISVTWCPTADMVGDYMTKPLQGATFRKF